MNRDYLEGRPGTVVSLLLIEQAAYHEAGHAAAIVLRNRQQNLPKTNFRISLQGLSRLMHSENQLKTEHNQLLQTKLEGGLLLENQIIHQRLHDSNPATFAYRQACEADVVNLLAGPLAEAKYVALRDGEYFNQHLVDYQALKNYGGKSDQEKIEAYLDGLGMPAMKRAEKVKELLSASFAFINQEHHWRAIASLADFIVSSKRDNISCEEAAALLETNLCPSNAHKGKLGFMNPLPSCYAAHCVMRLS